MLDDAASSYKKRDDKLCGYATALSGDRGLPAFTHPFGPPISPYEDAVGAIFRSWGESERSKAFVKSIVPNIFEGLEIGEIVPIEVVSQAEHKDGVVLTARISYDRPYEDSFDTRNRNG